MVLMGLSLRLIFECAIINFIKFLYMFCIKSKILEDYKIISNLKEFLNGLDIDKNLS